jgi:serine phosphatase RsbU (regulator of sigma subunit)
VAHLGQRALDVTDVGELIEDAVRLVAETIGVDLVAFRELTGEQDKVVIRTGLGWRESIGRTEAAGPGTQHGFALALEDPVEVEDLASEARFRPSSLLVERGAASGIAARVAGRNHPAGILEAFATEPRTFDRDDVHFMQAVANILGTALERDRAERDRAELLERERQSRAEAEGMQWGLAFLAVASNVLAGSLSVETTLSNVARLAVPSFADWCVVHLLQDDGSLAEVALAHSDPERVEWVRKLQERYPPDPDAQTGILAVAGTGRSEIYPEIPDELLAKAARDEEHLALLKDLGLRSAMIVPLISRGRTLGTITFVAAESGRRYGEIDLTMAEDLARRAGLAVDNARLYEASTRVARTLQRSLLPPELPRIPRIDLAARFRPAGRGDEVGGDFYDLFETANRNWAVVIGDVCGKGADAAAMTALARYTIRAAAIRDSRPSRVLSALNEGLLRQVSDQRFCTACYVRVRLASGSARLTVASGGHPLPIVVHPDGRTERVGRPGSLLGVFEDPEVFDHAVDLEAGDTMLLYTDGVIEQHDGDELFGEERLHSILSASSGERAEAIADRIERAVLSFQPNLPRDDMAVLVLQVAPS